MADAKISQLSEMTSTVSDYVLPIVNTTSLTTNKITVANLLKRSSTILYVGPAGSVADYVCDGVDDDVQINAAITAMNTAGGGVIKVLPGTYLLSEPVQLRSNVYLIGGGKANTVVKAKNSYTPSVLNPMSGYSVLLSYNNSSIQNNLIEGITFDGNGQNITPASYAGAAHRMIFFTGLTDMVFRFCEFKNSIHWVTDLRGTRLWFLYNKISSGWENYDAAKYVDGGQDGINTSVNHFWIIGNEIDTYGVATSSQRSSGDDAIVCREHDYLSATVPKNGVVAKNVIKSGSRGMLQLAKAGSPTNITYYGNIVEKSSASGFLLETSGATTGVHTDTTIDNCQFKNCAELLTGNGIGCNVAVNSVPFFQNLTIKNSKVSQTTSTASPYFGHGIWITGQGDTLNLSDCQVTGNAGSRAIGIGDGTNAITNITVSSPQATVTAGKNALYIQGVSKGSVEGGTLTGGGTATAITVRATGTASASYLNMSGVVCDNFGDGIVESNGGANPDYNKFTNIILKSVTTPITLLGTSTSAKNIDGCNPERLYAQGNVTGATTFNRINGDVITATLTGNITTTITNGKVNGDTLTLILTQDATGGWTISKPSNVKLVGGAFSPSAGANAVDQWTLKWDGTNWREIARALNQS